MLTEIREKTQGTFAWIILILICVPFALWGIQNYTGGGQENAVVIVGDKEFTQRDVNQAYAQFKQQYAQVQIPEELLKQQAIEKLVRDELLLQHVTDEKLAVSDEEVRKFISSLQYFQTDGKFNKKRYETVLGQQGMSSAQFVSRVKKAMLMEQFQKAVTDTSFVPEQELDSFFKIQNQTRQIEYATIKLKPVSNEPSSEEVNAFYQQHAADFQTPEQVSIEYIELSLPELMKEVQPTVEQLQTYYDENIEQFSKKERRKISHILFAKTKDTSEEQALAKAQAARKRLAQESFSELAAELSDDTLTAKNGGDLGLFEVGVMEPAFEKAATSLKLGEVSEPVKSAFGYHLITVTELVPAETISFAEAHDELAQAVKRKEAENLFYQLGESMTELSFENSDNLLAVADELGLQIQQTDLFSSTAGGGIADSELIRIAAFSEPVLQGHNSEPVELGEDHLVVLRLLDHQPAETKPLAEVRDVIVATLQNEQARKIVQQEAEKVKQVLLTGSTLGDAVSELGLEVKTISLRRDDNEIPWEVKQAVFKAAKPVSGKSTVFVVDSAQGDQTVVNLLSVTDGNKTSADLEKAKLAEANISRALGQSDYVAVIDGLRESTKVLIRQEQ